MAKAKKSKFAERFYLYLRYIWKRKLWIIFLVAVCTAAAVVYFHDTREKEAVGYLSLRYERAYEGQYPNGTRFNIYDIKSEEVLNRTLERAGLAEEMTTEMLAECLTLSPTSTQNVYNRYLATEYTATLTDTYLPKGYRADDVLNILLNSYEDYFYRNHVTNDDSLELDWSEVEDWEYSEFGSFMKVKVDKLITYLDELRASSGMSQYSLDGETFNSLRASVVDFRDIYLDAYNSFIWEKRLFRDSEDYHEKLEYRRFQLHQQIEQYESKYEIDQSALALYDSSMITFVMVPMYDQVHGLYMARTAIGTDQLAMDSEKDASALKTRKLRMAEVEDEIERVKRANSAALDRRKADEMIEGIQEKVNALVERIRTVSANYEKNRLKNDISHWLRGGSFSARFGLKNAVIVGAASGFAILIAYWIILDVKQTKVKK